MKQKVTAIIVAAALASALAGAGTAQANWLDVITSAAGAGSSGTSTTATPSVASKKAGRWAKVYEMDNYTIYIDTKSMTTEGQAQGRNVRGWFKRVYTPYGSQWLGDTSRGAVKPGVIAYSTYKAGYGTTSSWLPGGMNYYDAAGHLIFEGWLADCNDEARLGSYEPDTPNERIKDILFSSVGWNY